MATGGSKVNMSEETFDYICTSCAEDDEIKKALKYCIECQQYYCKDCIKVHRKIPVSKGHSLLEISDVSIQGQPRTLPAFPTKQCSKHAGKILDMFCKDHDVVCCYICAAEDHRTCDGMISVSDNINQLYSKTDTSKTGSDINRMLDVMNERQNESNGVLQELRESKETAIKAANDFRIEMEQLLRKLEDVTINDIENEYKKSETQLLEERKRYENSIGQLKNLELSLTQASGNIAQQFVCSKIAQQYIKAIDTGELSSSSVCLEEVIFKPFKDLKTSLERLPSLGTISEMLSGDKDLYKYTKIFDMDVKLQDDSNCLITGSCIVDDTVLFTDCWNDKLKRFNISSSSLIGYCKVPENPRGLCMVGDNEVAVACKNVVQFVTTDKKLSLTRSIKMNHGKSYGIAYNDDKLYITDRSKSLYMYDMSGNILKTVTSDNTGQALFGCSNHITFNYKNNRLFVGDNKKGLVCFNAQCDYIEAITDPDIRPDGVCVDGYGNIIVANVNLQTIVQCDRNGQKRGIIVDETKCPQHPRSVCIHPRLKRMFVSHGVVQQNRVLAYHLY